MTTAQMVWLPRSSGPVLQQPSRKNPVGGSVPHDSSSPARTLRSATDPASGTVTRSSHRPGWLLSRRSALRGQRTDVRSAEGAATMLPVTGTKFGVNAMRSRLSRTSPIWCAEPTSSATTCSPLRTTSVGYRPFMALIAAGTISARLRLRTYVLKHLLLERGAAGPGCRDAGPVVRWSRGARSRRRSHEDRAPTRACRGRRWSSGCRLWSGCWWRSSGVWPMRTISLARELAEALIQPYSGHESRQSLEIYSRLALAGAQQHYDEAITRVPCRTTATLRAGPHSGELGRNG